MKKIILCQSFLVLFSLFVFDSFGQNMPDSSLYRVETGDGSRYVGTISFTDSSTILLKTQNIGEVLIKIKDVVQISALIINSNKHGKIFPYNTQSVKYFISQNAYGLKAGEITFQNNWILFNQINFGISNYLSLGFGCVPLFLFHGAPTPVWINSKFSVPVLKDKINLGGGILGGLFLTEDEMGFGIAYGMSTFGTRDDNLSLGIGYGFADKEWSRYPVISIDGMIRVGPKGYVIAESFVVPIKSSYGIFSLGGRYIANNVGIDYGLIVPLLEEWDLNFAIPWLGVNFNLKKASRTR